MSDVDAQLSKHFKGFGRISFDSIDFDSGRDLVIENVQRLVDIFRLEGCDRSAPANAISGVIEENIIEEQINTSVHVPRTPTYQTDPPFITSRILCLHGKHRICAARRFLVPTDHWWTVKLYSSGKTCQSRKLA